MNGKHVFVVVAAAVFSMAALARPLTERTAAEGLSFWISPKDDEAGILVIRDLAPGNYQLLKNGYPVGTWSAKAFAAGVDLDAIGPLPGEGKPKCYNLTLKSAVTVGAESLLPKPRRMTLGVGSRRYDPAAVSSVRDASLPHEAYRIHIGADGVCLTASDDAGFAYARQTLEQLVGVDGETLPYLEIEDSPAYSWRGIHVDESRHFLGYAALKRLIDRMAEYKFNVLHWHLTDDTGWRLEIKKYPRLTTIGASRRWSTVRYRRGEEDGVPEGPLFYTQEQAKEIVAYAAARNITVVPEIELPGHAIAAVAAYPELSCYGEKLPITHPFQPFVWLPYVFCPGKDTTIRFLEDVLDETCAIFPSKTIHIGGDECVKKSWKTCPHCQARIKANGLKDEDDLQSWVTRHFTEYLAKKGRRTIGWDEILDCGLPPGAAVMSWRGASRGITAAKQGQYVVMTPHEWCYYDYDQGIPSDPYEYIGGLITLEQAYRFDPVAGIPAENRNFVLGAQANNWGEYTINEMDRDWKLWPRALALAEVLWTAPAVRDYPEFEARARVHRERLVSKGVNAAPVWTAPHIRLVVPADGATVSTLTDLQDDYLSRDRADRRVYFADAAKRKTLAAGGWAQRPVELVWTADPNETGAGVRYAVEVRRAKDNLPVALMTVATTNAAIDNLEVATDYLWTVTPVADNVARPSATGRFRTAERAPRTLRIDGVFNGRDLGGRRGLGGRRVRQGLIFRTGGLNEEAVRTYYTKEELIARDADGARRAASDKLDRTIAEWTARAASSEPFVPVAVDVGHEWTIFCVDDEVFKDEATFRKLDALREIPSELFGVKRGTLVTDAKGTYVFADNVHGTQVLCREFDASADGWTLLGASGDWFWDLRLNGELIADFRLGNRGNPADAAANPVAARVKKGRNLLVASLKHGMGGCTWSCRALEPIDRAAFAKVAIGNAKDIKTALWTVVKSMAPGADRVTDEGRRQMLDELGIRTEIDLRTAGETGPMTISPLGPRCRYHRITSSAYAGMKTENAHEAFAKSFRLMLDPANYGICFHCAAGQDRTGALAFVLLALLGVDEEELYRDWEATGFWNHRASFNHANLFDYLVGYMKTLPGANWTEKVEAYVRSCGFTDDDIAKFRAIMLED